MDRIKSIVLIFCLLPVFLLVGCKKNNESTDNYYIKYEVASKSIHYETIDIEVNTEVGKQSFEAILTPYPGTGFSSKPCKTVFSESFGTVEKGFQTSIKATTSYDVVLEVKIYACKSNEQYVLKSTKTSYGSCTDTYIIDF